MWWRVDQGPVEAGGLRVQGQNQLVFAEQGFWVRLWVGLPLREGDDASSAESVSPTHTNTHRYCYVFEPGWTGPNKHSVQLRQEVNSIDQDGLGINSYDITHSLPSSSMSSTSYLE